MNSVEFNQLQARVSRWTWLDPEDLLGEIPLHLERAAAGIEVAWNLSGCFDAVRRQKATLITAAVRDELIRLAVGAEVAAHACFPESDRRDIHSGMQALADVFALWASPEDGRQHLDLDNRDRRRVLQNLSHNLVLREDIESRAYERRAVEIEKLIAPAARKSGGRP